MKKIFVRALSLLVSFAAALTMSVCACAAGSNGIYASKSVLARGERFTVTINIPPMANADTASIKAEFDANAFEVLSWSPTLANSVSNYGSNFFIVTSANADRNIDLSRGVELSAVVSVKSTAPDGNYAFILKQHSLSYVNDNGYDYTELWTPSVTTANVRISTATDSSGSQTSTQTGTQNSSDSSNNNSGAGVSVRSSLSGVANRNISISVSNAAAMANMDIMLSNTGEAAEYASRALTRLGFTRRRCYSFDISITDRTTGNAVHTLQNGYVDLAIPIPDSFSDSCKEAAVYHINGGNPELIASSVGTVNGTRSVRFRASSFSPYMIVDMTAEEQPEPVNNTSVAANDDGEDEDEVQTVPDSDQEPQPEREESIANDDDPDEDTQFVPYTGDVNAGEGDNDDEVIINENADEPTPTSASNYTVKTGNTSDNNGSGTAPSTGTPRNPHTGVTAAITLPAVLVGCVVLSRKIARRRKRTKKYIES